MTPAEAPQTAPPTIRRIVVAIDSSDHGRTALETAARLAERLDAEIEAVFVEDENLVRLANLPLGREFRLTTAEPHTFDVTVMEERFRTERHRARHAFRTVTERVRVHSQFRVVRGGVTSELLAAAERAELIILGMSGHEVRARPRLGSVALAVAQQSKTSVLLMRRGATLAGRPLVYYDGSEGSRRALALAEQVANRETGVRVLVVATDETTRRRLHAEAELELRSHGYAVRFVDATAPDLTDLCGFASSAEADILLIDAENALVAGESRASLLQQIACPVLLVH